MPRTRWIVLGAALVLIAASLLGGRGEELLLGSYVLLERLGEGGMGEVFKARNWKLGQTVALKLISKARMLAICAASCPSDGIETSSVPWNASFRAAWLILRLTSIA